MFQVLRTVIEHTLLHERERHSLGVNDAFNVF